MSGTAITVSHGHLVRRAPAGHGGTSAVCQKIVGVFTNSSANMPPPTRPWLPWRKRHVAMEGPWQPRRRPARRTSQQHRHMCGPAGWCRPGGRPVSEMSKSLAVSIAPAEKTHRPCQHLPGAARAVLATSTTPVARPGGPVSILATRVADQYRAMPRCHRVRQYRVVGPGFCVHRTGETNASESSARMRGRPPKGAVFTIRGTAAVGQPRR